MQQPMNPRRNSVFSALVKAPFFSGDLARDVAHNWRGIGLRLLLLVLMISWIITGLSWHRTFRHVAENEFPRIVEDFPPITIKDGVVSSPVDQPYYMKEKDSGKTFAVLDTTGTVTSLDDEGADGAIILLTENKLHYRENNNNGQTKIQDLSHVKNFYVDRPIITSWVNWGAKWAAFVLIPISLVFSLIYRLIQGLIYAAIGMIWNSAFNARLSYQTVLRLSFVAIVPVILLDTLLPFTNVHVPAWSFICLAIAQVYLAMAVKANEQAPAPPAYAYGNPNPPMPQNPFQQQYPQPPR